MITVVRMHEQCHSTDFLTPVIPSQQFEKEVPLSFKIPLVKPKVLLTIYNNMIYLERGSQCIVLLLKTLDIFSAW